MNDQEISKVMKLHIKGVWQNARKFIRQLAHDITTAWHRGTLVISEY